MPNTYAFVKQIFSRSQESRDYTGMKWDNLKKSGRLSCSQISTICVTLNAKFPLCASSIFGYNARRKFRLRDLACGKITGKSRHNARTIHILAIKTDKQ